MVADKSRRATEAGMRVPRVLVAWLWCACHSVSPPLPASLSGNYRFVEQPATMNEPIVGGIVIRGDTLIAVNDAGVCEYDARASQHDNVIVYRCGIVTLRFDRRDPIGKATYETTASVQSRQVICDERQRGCARPRVENTTVARPVSGKLHLKRIDEPRDRANARG
jgi:hypothetical protein